MIDSIDFETITLVNNIKNLKKYLQNNDSYESIYNDIIDEKKISSRDVFESSLSILSNLIEDDLIFEGKIINEYYTDNDISNFKKKYNDISDFKIKRFEYDSIIVESKFQDIYNHVYFQLSADFGHYFRNLYRLIKLIDEKEFEKNMIKNFETKYFYTSIIRSQLSDNETKWLFLNCLSDKGHEKFKPYLEKYSMLKILNDSDNIYQYYSRLYDKSAFKKPSDGDLILHLEKYNFKNTDSKFSPLLLS